ncbi:MarR family winged helix-turn-helix transcriptional regulator [Thermoactinospora rubra]|uniref:MarR family winged helix-turn-helix transcriptional regulator n=1 Tax=Thermoactinospora rubra TaxID=1088767 RepID=UPI000A116AF1|nr:MarR family transcriptional regulator [Thermoactinospora rubra]
MQPVDARDLDTGTLALFLGTAAAAVVQDDLEAAGFTGLRLSHGYLVQHLVESEPTVGELAVKLEVTQQGASKAVAELERLGYAERFADPRDARVRRVRLTSRGRDAVEAARRARRSLEERFRRRIGEDQLGEARAVLADLLDELGGTGAVRRREVRPPR